MRAARLSALYKTPERVLTDVRPVACGKAERRLVGSAMVEVARGRTEDLFLSFNQFSFAADGCQIALNVLRQRLAEHPDHVCI